jgi:Kef-type K+ transport system membrane component KefB
VTVVIVSLGLILIGVNTEISILLGCIASATAPAAIMDIVMESKSKSKFSNLLLTVVAIDDAWGFMLFSIGIAAVTALSGNEGGMSPFLTAALDIGGSVLLGIIVGLPAAYLTGRIKKGQPMLIEALGFIFLCGGLAVMFDVSFLIASMVMGAVVTNLAKHHDYPFHAVEGIEWPFMIIFFILAGASLKLSALSDIRLIGLVYIICRTVGKIFGARIGAKFSRTNPATRRWIGVAMLPQAGAAVGMALVASNKFPDYSQTLLTIVISTTILFEIIGPVFTRMAIQHTKKRNQK